MSVSCQYCMLPGRSLCDWLIARPEDSYRVWCVSVIAKPGKGRPSSSNNRSQWPREVRRGSVAARLLGLRVRKPPEAWMSVSCQYCMLPGRGLCDWLIARPEDSYRVWCVSVIAKPGKGRPWPRFGSNHQKREKIKQSLMLYSVRK